MHNTKKVQNIHHKHAVMKVNTHNGCVINSTKNFCAVKEATAFSESLLDVNSCSTSSPTSVFGTGSYCSAYTHCGLRRR